MRLDVAGAHARAYRAMTFSSKSGKLRAYVGIYVGHELVALDVQHHMVLGRGHRLRRIAVAVVAGRLLLLVIKGARLVSLSRLNRQNSLHLRLGSIVFTCIFSKYHMLLINDSSSCQE